MKTAVLFLLIILITGCATIEVSNQPREWFSGYELQLLYGPEKAKKLMKAASDINTTKARTVRDNMRTGNIEYKITID